MLLRRIARPLLSAAFIAEGIDTLQNPRPLADKLGPVLDTARRKTQQNDAGFAIAPSAARTDPLDTTMQNPRVENYPATGGALPGDAESGRKLPTPPLPESPETLARVIAGAQIGSALLLAIGKAPRPAAAALAATSAVSLSSHAFWAETDPDRKKFERTQFLTGLSKIGGLLIAAADTEGQPSLGWRGRRAANNAKEHAEALAATAAALAATARERGSEFVDTARDRGADLAGTAKEKVHYVDSSPTLSRRSRRAARNAKGRAAGLAETVRDKGPEWAETAREKGSEFADVAREKGSEIADTVREKGPEWAETARERGAEFADVAREKGSQWAEVAREKGAEWADTARDRGPEIAEAARERAQRAAEIARDKAEIARLRAAELKKR